MDPTPAVGFVTETKAVVAVHSDDTTIDYFVSLDFGETWDTGSEG
jgi:hypothetical protein